MSRIDITVGQPRWRSRASRALTRGWGTSRSSRQPAARTSSSAAIALIVLAMTAIPMPSQGPNRRPEANVNAVRGNGKTVTTMWVAKKTNGNHGPTDVAQSRSAVAPGRGTSNKIATRITIVAAMAANCRGGTCLAVQITAPRSAARVLTTDFTPTKTTGRTGITRPARIARRLPGARCADSDDLA